MESNQRYLAFDKMPELPGAGKIATGEAVRGCACCLLLANDYRIECVKTDGDSAARASQVVSAV